MQTPLTASGTTSSHAFVYGTLRVPAVLARVLGRVPALVNAELRDYRRGRVVGQSYPAVLAAPGATVDGAVLLDVRDGEWPLLDAYEGELYVRREVTVTLDTQLSCEAHCYVLAPGSAHLFDPAPWSLETFVERDLGELLRELA